MTGNTQIQQGMLQKNNYHHTDSCSNCLYKLSDGNRIIKCTKFTGYPLVHQAYICDRWEPAIRWSTENKSPAKE